MRATIALNSGCSPIPVGTRMGWKTHINLNTSPITNHLSLSVHFVRYSPAYQGELALGQARLLGSFLLNFGSLHITPGRTCCKSSTRENFPWHHDISSWGPLGRQAWVNQALKLWNSPESNGAETVSLFLSERGLKGSWSLAISHKLLGGSMNNELNP